MIIVLVVFPSAVPPFGQAVESDWYFNQLKYHRYQEFWSVHARNHDVARRISSISQDAKDIIHGMLEVPFSSNCHVYQRHQRITLCGFLFKINLIGFFFLFQMSTRPILRAAGRSRRWP
jgi:hypothetical protein